MASPASSSSSSSSTPSVAKHAALAFFDSQPTSFPNLLQQSNDESWAAGRAQLAASIGVDLATLMKLESAPDSIPSANNGWLPSAEAEQEEVSAFIAWASNEAKDLVRQVSEELPPAVFAEHAALIARAELIDLSPKGRVDDEVFAEHRDVWEKITRGCAVIRLHPTPAAGVNATPIMRWAVRANRKFTGHEDENEVALDGKLYVVDHGVGSSTQVVVSHKCNGSVLHLAARDINLWGNSKETNSRWVFLGSKKVHVGAIWNPISGVQDWLKKMSCFTQDRHEYVSEMVTFIAPKLSSHGELILASLAKWRLVINAEYVSSVGTGPTDNQRIYGLSSADARESFAFLLTSNTLRPLGGMELGLEVIYGMKLMNSWTFATVSAFLIPIEKLPLVKSEVIPLQDIEGAVLYYYDKSSQILSLEKWKSSNYVIVRAVREKLRPFIFGSGGKNKIKGIEELMVQLDAESKGLSAFKITKVSFTQEQIAAQSVQTKDAKGAAAAAKKAKKKQEKAAKAAAVAVGQAMESMQIGASSSAAASSASAASASPVAVVASSLFLEFSHPEIDSFGSNLTEIGGSKIRKGVWRVECPRSVEEEITLRNKVIAAYKSTILQKPFNAALMKVTERVQGRIKAIDHIPLSDVERETWLRDSALFLAWLMEQLVERKRWQPKEVMAQYSQMWSIFRDEQAAAAKAKQ